MNNLEDFRKLLQQRPQQIRDSNSAKEAAERLSAQQNTLRQQSEEQEKNRVRETKIQQNIARISEFDQQFGVTARFTEIARLIGVEAISKLEQKETNVSLRLSLPYRTKKGRYMMEIIDDYIPVSMGMSMDGGIVSHQQESTIVPLTDELVVVVSSIFHDGPNQSQYDAVLVEFSNNYWKTSQKAKNPNRDVYHFYEVEVGYCRFELTESDPNQFTEELNQKFIALYDSYLQEIGQE